MSQDHSIQALLQRSSKQLAIVSDSAYLDAELLLAHCLEKNRTYLHTWPETELNQKQLHYFDSLISKRLTDYPVAYLIGKKPFWSFELNVTPDVLIPRPETELLVEVALEKLKGIKNPKILELGTGSGAIAIAIASERPDAIIIATDYSIKAIEIAKQNAAKLKIDKNITFLKSDWFANLDLDNESFDAILSNPPYIDPIDAHLKESIRYEPQQALVAENKGMSDLVIIIEKSPPFLKKGGLLILEHGYDQGENIRLLIKKYYSKVTSNIDLNKLERITCGIKN